MDTPLARKLANYKPDSSTQQLVKETPILLLVGPTGAGKDSLKDKLLETGEYHHIVSHTTRPPRINHGIIEQDGREYHFIDKAAAEKMLDEHGFIEAKIYSGNLYGTSVAEIRAAHDQGKIAMTDIEVQGVAEYKELDPGVMAVFLLPPDFKTWQERLQRRYGDVVDAADSRLRMETALQELRQLLATDYYVAVINDDLEETFNHIKTVTSSQTHTTPDEPRARDVAKQLEQDIQAHLDQTERHA
jgi:guanylate kinase